MSFQYIWQQEEMEIFGCQIQEHTVTQGEAAKINT